MSEIRLKCDKCKKFRDDKECWVICDGCYEDPKNIIDEFLNDLKIYGDKVKSLREKWEEKKNEI